MTTLREKIDGLRRYSPASAGKMADKDEGRWIFRNEVLRVIAEHEAEQSVPIVDMTPDGVQPFCGVHQSRKVGAFTLLPSGSNFTLSGGLACDGSCGHAPPVGQAGGEEFRAGLPAEGLRKAWADWEERDSQSLPEQLTFSGETVRYASWPESQSNMPLTGGTWRGCRFRPVGKTWAEVEAMARTAEQPTMECPRCSKEYPDFDGFGVVYCAPPDGCGYCRHLARSGLPDGSMKCDFCGDVAAEVPKCHAGQDGDCYWTGCPQNRDGEPRSSGRSCPLWESTEES